MASQNEIARAEVILNGQKANATLKELEAAARALNAELRKMPVNSNEFAKKSEEYQQVKNRLFQVKTEINGTTTALSRMADAANKYFQLFTMIGVAVAGAVMAIRRMIKASADLSDSLANIRKTTGMTADEVDRLNMALKDIDTRTSREELRQMAMVAGQLGVATKDIVPFVSAVDKLNIVFGNEIGGGAENVAKEIGTLRNVLVDFKTNDISEDVLKLGNAINTLGLEGFATAPVIIDFASRIGGIGIPLGLTTGQVLGLSATLQELAVGTEKGGTAVGRILQKMTTNTAEFAKVANMDLKSFTKLVNTDLYGAFVKVVEGSKQSGQSATLLAHLIKDLEIAGMGASEVFGKLGGNLPMLTERVTMMDKELQTSAGIMEIYKVKNENLAATLEKLGKEWNSLITMPAVVEFFTSMVNHTRDLVAWLKELPQTIERNRIALTVLTGAFLVWIAAKTRALQIALLNNLTMKEGILLKIKDAVVLEALIIKEKLLTVWRAEGTVATKLATTAQLAWNAALRANPIGLVITAIAGLVAGIKYLETHSSSAIALEKEKASMSVLLANANSKLETSYSKLSNQVRNLNQMSNEQKASLREEISLTLKKAEAELLVMETRQKAIGKKAETPTFWQDLKARLGAPERGKEIVEYYAWENSKKAMEEFSEGITALRTKINQIKTEKINLENLLFSEHSADNIKLKTFDALTEKLNKYQIALRSTTAGSEDFTRIQRKITQTTKELAQFNTTSSETEVSDKKKLVTSYEKLSKKIEEYISALREQVKTSPQLAAETARKIAMLEKEKKAIDDLVQSLREKAKFDNKSKITTTHTIGVEGYVKEKFEEDLRKEITKREKEEKQRRDGILLDKLEKVDNEPNQPGEMGFEEEPETQTEIWAKKAAQVAGYAQSVANQLMTVDQLMRQMEEAQLARDEAYNNKKKENLKKQLDSRIISQKQYDAAMGKLDQEAEAKRRKMLHDQAVRQKALSLVQAVINVAQGVTAALSMPPPASYIMAALTGILGAIQIGYIANQEIPQAAKGKYDQIENTNLIGSDSDGLKRIHDTYLSDEPTARAAANQKPLSDVPQSERFNVKGKDDKKVYPGVSPAAGKTGIVDSPSVIPDDIPLVIDAGTTRFIQSEYPWIMDAIYRAAEVTPSGDNYTVKGQKDGRIYNNLQFQNATTGIYSKPILISEQGPEMIVDAPTLKNIQINYPWVIEAINYARVPQFATGKYPQEIQRTVSTSTMQSIPAKDQELLSAIQLLSRQLDRGIQAFIVYDDLNEKLAKVDQIKSDVKNS